MNALNALWDSILALKIPKNASCVPKVMVFLLMVQINVKNVPNIVRNVQKIPNVINVWTVIPFF
jgi:hypothetical protein